MKKHHSPYKVGLGRAFLDRAGAIFLSFILVTMLVGGSAVYAEYKTGKLRETVVKPVKQFLQGVAKTFENTDPPKTLTDPSEIISTSSATIKINTKDDMTIETNTITTNKGTQKTIITYPAPTTNTYPGKSYEQSVKEMNENAQKQYEEALKAQEEWSKQKQAENQKWFEETSKKNEQEAQTWYDQRVQESQLKLEQWKKEHGF